jgi:FtsP/CotA-like multicopper oxidase with cupredoxin domain
VQVASGMAGAIIVEGDFADVPEIARARERVMLLTQVVFDAFGMVEGFVTLFPETSTRFLAINGQRRPTIDMRPGEVQRWRLVGSQYQDDMLLELDKHRLNVIAYDGIQLGTLQEMKQLLIAPGQRVATRIHCDNQIKIFDPADPDCYRHSNHPPAISRGC